MTGVQTCALPIFPVTSHLLDDLQKALAHLPAVAWLAKALACAVGGLLTGFVMEKLVGLFKKLFRKQ